MNPTTFLNSLNDILEKIETLREPNTSLEMAKVIKTFTLNPLEDVASSKIISAFRTSYPLQVTLEKDPYTKTSLESLVYTAKNFYTFPIDTAEKSVPKCFKKEDKIFKSVLKGFIELYHWEVPVVFKVSLRGYIQKAEVHPKQDKYFSILFNNQGFPYIVVGNSFPKVFGKPIDWEKQKQNAEIFKARCAIQGEL